MSRSVLRRIVPWVLPCLLACVGRSLAAPPGTTRIEEDWELVVLDPSIVEVGPQITTIMAPEPNPARTLMIFNLNFREEPFRAGGFQVDCWYDETLISEKSSERTWPLWVNNETIRWTQRLSVSGNILTYSVRNGTSQSWGPFGGEGTLRLSVTTHVNSLESYDSSFSVENSKVGWQANRVQRLRLVAVRYYDGDTLLETEETPRDVDLKFQSS